MSPSALATRNVDPWLMVTRSRPRELDTQLVSVDGEGPDSGMPRTRAGAVRPTGSLSGAAAVRLKRRGLTPCGDLRRPCCGPVARARSHEPAPGCAVRVRTRPRERSVRERRRGATVQP